MEYGKRRSGSSFLVHSYCQWLVTCWAIFIFIVYFYRASEQSSNIRAEKMKYNFPLLAAAGAGGAGY